MKHFLNLPISQDRLYSLGRAFRYFNDMCPISGNKQLDYSYLIFLPIQSSCFDIPANNGRLLSGFE